MPDDSRSREQLIQSCTTENTRKFIFCSGQVRVQTTTQWEFCGMICRWCKKSQIYYRTEAVLYGGMVKRFLLTRFIYFLPDYEWLKNIFLKALQSIIVFLSFVQTESVDLVLWFLGKIRTPLMSNSCRIVRKGSLTFSRTGGLTGLLIHMFQTECACWCRGDVTAADPAQSGSLLAHICRRLCSFVCNPSHFLQRISSNWSDNCKMVISWCECYRKHMTRYAVLPGCPTEWLAAEDFLFFGGGGGVEGWAAAGNWRL